MISCGEKNRIPTLLCKVVGLMSVGCPSALQCEGVEILKDIEKYEYV